MGRTAWLVLALAVGCVRAGGGQAADDGPRATDHARPDVLQHHDAQQDLRADAADQGAPTVGQQSLAIIDNLDDGQIVDNWQTQWFPAGEPGGITFAGQFASGNAAVWAYLRFALIKPIPAGSRITQATLRAFGLHLYQWDILTDALQVTLEDSADAPRVQSEDDAPDSGIGRKELPLSVRWPATGGLNWAVGAYNASPNLQSLVQALVDARGGLEQGAHLQFWLRHVDRMVDSEVGMEDFSKDPVAGAHAQLDLGWSPGGGN